MKHLAFMKPARVVLLLIAGAVLFGLGVWVGSSGSEEPKAGHGKAIECSREQCAQLFDASGRSREFEQRDAVEHAAVISEREARQPAFNGIDAGLPGDAGLLQLLARSGCHAVKGGTPPAPLRSPQGIAPANLEVQNDCEEPVMISFIDFEGRERDLPFVLPSAQSLVKSYAGHIYRLRIADAQRSWIRDVTVPKIPLSRVWACGCENGHADPQYFEVLDAGVRPPAADVPKCLVPFDAVEATPRASVGGGAKVNVVFRNSCTDTPVRLQWIQFDGSLRPAETFDPGLTFDQTTYLGHRWRVTDVNTGRIIRDFEIDGGTPIDLCPCPAPR